MIFHSYVNVPEAMNLSKHMESANLSGRTSQGWGLQANTWSNESNKVAILIETIFQKVVVAQTTDEWNRSYCFWKPYITYMYTNYGVQATSSKWMCDWYWKTTNTCVNKEQGTKTASKVQDTDKTRKDCHQPPDSYSKIDMGKFHLGFI